MSGAVITRRLAERAHEVHIPLRRSREDYPALVSPPWRSNQQNVVVYDDVAHGSESMNAFIESVGAEVFVIHAHPMTDFRSTDYSIAAAVEQMTTGIDRQMSAFAAHGGKVIVYSGTIFEPDNGLSPRPGISRYGISKLAVFEIIRLAADRVGLDVRKVVIPNPFGAGESGRFGNYLAGSWRDNVVPAVRTPLYIRDNIPSAELAIRYVDYIEAGNERRDVIRPSGYIENQHDFALRVAREIGERLGRDLPIDAAAQTVFDEPIVLVNDGSRSIEFRSVEKEFWDEYASSFA
jgi:nucleoside-diphosphate-sugar epimerase